MDANDLDGVLGTRHGGTGITAAKQGAILLGADTLPFETLSPGSSGQVLTSNGVAPAWGSVPAHTHAIADLTDDGALAALNTVGTSQIDNDAVTYAKIQNVSATDKVLGRSSAGSGDVEEIACTSAGRALIDDADAAAQRTTLGLGTAALADLIVAFKSSDQTGIGTSFADVTGTELVGLASGVYYAFEFWLWCDSDTTTTGIDVSVNSATSAAYFAATVTAWSGANSQVYRGITAYDTDTAFTSSNGASTRLYKIEGVIALTGTGNLIARAKRENVGSGPAVRAGSFGRAWKLA